MAATVYGSINWGLTAEAGLYVESAEFDTNIETVWIADEQGNDVAGATFNAAAGFTCTGFVNGGGFSAVTGSAVTLANAIDWGSVLPASGGTTIVTGIKTGKNHKNAESQDVTGIFKPYLV